MKEKIHNFNDSYRNDNSNYSLIFCAEDKITNINSHDFLYVINDQFFVFHILIIIKRKPSTKVSSCKYMGKQY